MSALGVFNLCLPVLGVPVHCLGMPHALGVAQLFCLFVLRHVAVLQRGIFASSDAGFFFCNFGSPGALLCAAARASLSPLLMRRDAVLLLFVLHRNLSLASVAVSHAWLTTHSEVSGPLVDQQSSDARGVYI